MLYCVSTSFQENANWLVEVGLVVYLKTFWEVVTLLLQSLSRQRVLLWTGETHQAWGEHGSEPPSWEVLWDTHTHHHHHQTIQFGCTHLHMQLPWLSGETFIKTKVMIKFLLTKMHLKAVEAHLLPDINVCEIMKISTIQPLFLKSCFAVGFVLVKY